MNRNKTISLLLAGLIAVTLLWGLSLLMGWSASLASAAPGQLFVKPDGTGTACSRANPCTLQTALAQATDGDIIYLAGGRYTGTGATVITLTKSVTLYGGWDGAASGPVARDPDVHPTMLDGERQRRVVYITGNITPTLDGLIIVNGNATGLTAHCPVIAGPPDGCGGGISVYNAHPVLTNNVITNNVAAMTSAGYPTGTTGYGGGLLLLNADRAVIRKNVVISNAASTANQGIGGGIAVFGTSTDLRVESNRVISNYATTTSKHSWGGGIAGKPYGALILENLIKGNHANGANGGDGGGLYQWYGAAQYAGNIVRGNYGSSAVYLGYSNARFEGNLVQDNPSGSGIELTSGGVDGPLYLINNIIAHSGNRQTLLAWAYSSAPLTAFLVHNTLVGTGSQQGVFIRSGYVTLYITNTIIASHTWGITNAFPAKSTVFADHTLFWANTSDGIRGTNPVDGDPAFVDPDGGNYHIGLGSAAIDAGIDAGISADIDGDPRPIGAGYDIGADEAPEFRRIYLPLAVRE